MSLILAIIVVLSTVYGFSLGIYFFYYRININNSLRLPIVITGVGLTGALMAGLTLVSLLPPVHFLFTLASLLLGVIITAIILFKRTKSDNTRVWGDEKDDMVVINMDIDLGSRF